MIDALTQETSSAFRDALRTLARIPPASRPVWTRAQQFALDELERRVLRRVRAREVGGGDHMLRDFCGPKGQPDDSPADDTAEDEAAETDG